MTQFPKYVFPWVVLLAAGVSSAATVVVDTCGQEVANRDQGVLAGDLDCSGTSSPAVVLGRRAALDLAGFTLTGGNFDAVYCARNCIVTGGTLAGAGRNCVRAADGTATLTGMLLNGCGGGARFPAAVEGRSLIISTSTVLSTVGSALWAQKKLSMSSSSVDGCGWVGVHAQRKVKITDSTVADCEFGVSSSRVKLRSSSVTDYGCLGITGGRLRAIDSTVSNSTPGSGSCAAGGGSLDISTARRPRLVDSTCERSHDFSSDPLYVDLPSWDVCSLD